MSRTVSTVRNHLLQCIRNVSELAWLFSCVPEKDFTRNRKLPFETMIKTLLCMEGGSLTNELMKRFGCQADLVSASAFVQQRGKILPEAFETIFRLFTETFEAGPLYKGYRLLAVDGSDIQIPTNPQDPESYFPGANGQKPYNLLHLNAMYDLLQRTYVDAIVQKRHVYDECRTLVDMVDRSSRKQPAIIIADRAYESYNVLAHIQEKGWYFLIRVKDVGRLTGFAAGLDLPPTDTFDYPIQLSITRKQTNEIKQLCKQRNNYRCIPANVIFDYLPTKNIRQQPALFYQLSFRMVRFQITENTYETVVTNLPTDTFPSFELKKLYAMRWGIETSFRELKYTLGLLHFHAKKTEHILQEIFAKLTMYNFSELITSHVVIQKQNRKYTYRANFSAAVHVCRQFFLGNVSPPDVEALIARHISPIRPGRSKPRVLSAKTAVSFLYRIA